MWLRHSLVYQEPSMSHPSNLTSAWDTSSVGQPADISLLELSIWVNTWCIAAHCGGRWTGCSVALHGCRPRWQSMW